MAETLMQTTSLAPDIIGGDSDLTDIEDEEIPQIRTRRGHASIPSDSRGRGGGGGKAVALPESRLIRTRSSRKTLKAMTPLAASHSSTPEPPPPTKTPRKRPLSTATPSFTKRARIPKPENIPLPASPQKPSSPQKPLSVYDANDIVWIKLDSLGELFEESASEIAPLSYWWPAKVITDDPLSPTVRTFGNDGRGRRRKIQIEDTSPNLIRSFKNQDGLEFSVSDFLSSPGDEKSAKENASLLSGISKRWKEAVEEASEAEKEEELPEDLSTLFKNSQSVMAQKRHEEESVEALEDMQSTPSSSRIKQRATTPLDESIDYGEEKPELVLARDHVNRPVHWPARVMDIGKDERSGRWLYQLSYIDGKTKKVPRSAFFSPLDEGFATCKLGEWVTILPDSEFDTEEGNRGDECEASPHPESVVLPDMSAPEDFCQLKVRDQMRYVYPFLCKIIRREYAPSITRHDDFFKGGKKRDKLAENADRGELTEREMEYVSGLVRRAMLQTERWAERVEDGDHVDGSSSDHSEGRNVAENMSTGADSTGGPAPNPSLDVESTPAEPNDQTASPAQQPANGEAEATIPDAMEVDAPAAQFPAAPPRPTGDENYEQLSGKDRISYCADVLLPEAIIQLHLFRKGLRTSTTLLSPEEEQALYEKGLKLVAKNEVHWVAKLVELHTLAKKRYEKKQQQKRRLEPVEEVVTGGTVTRPRRELRPGGRGL